MALAPILAAVLKTAGSYNDAAPTALAPILAIVLKTAGSYNTPQLFHEPHGCG